MPALKAAIVRVIEEGQPQWAECRFTDAAGYEHVLVEKIPVLTDQEVTPDGPFPIPVALECVVRITAPKSSIVRVDLAQPWGIQSDAGLSCFDVASHQVVPSVFVSCADIDKPEPQSLLESLRNAGCLVNYSPRQPDSGEDPRWPSWYERGLPHAVSRADAFVIVIDQTWDSSTWMAEEAREALDVAGVPHAFFWNPRLLAVAAMHRYLRTALPRDANAAARVVTSTRPRTAV